LSFYDPFMGKINKQTLDLTDDFDSVIMELH
ncbi:TPA: RluA family pseudouridine synthase, partial [Streptococcus agalactiae]